MFYFSLFGDVAFSEYFFVPFPLSLINSMESTPYVVSFRMAFFYLVTTGWIFDISSCENSINQSNQSYLEVRTVFRQYLEEPWKQLAATLLSTCPLYTNSCCCCCCCLHIKSRSGLYSVLSNIRTGPTDADAFRGHRPTTQKGYTYQKEIHTRDNWKNKIKPPRKIRLQTVRRRRRHVRQRR